MSRLGDRFLFREIILPSSDLIIQMISCDRASIDYIPIFLFHAIRAIINKTVSLLWREAGTFPFTGDFRL